MSDVLKSRFKVHRNTVVEHADSKYAKVFFVPLLPEYDEHSPEPVADVLFEVEASTIPDDFQFTTTTADGQEEGVELILTNPIPIGAIVDLEIRIVWVPA